MKATDAQVSLDADLAATDLPRVGGDLALDFVNTAEYRGTPQAVDFLTSAARVAAWCAHARLIDDATLATLVRALSRQPRQGDALLRSAVDLRDALYGVFRGLARGEAPTQAALRPLNASLAALSPHHTLRITEGGIGWSWDDDDGMQARLLGPVCLAAADLLADARRAPLKQCPGCGWLFIDTSRNGMRRWCSMAWCGSTTKSRRQYERRKDAETKRAARKRG